ncbi:MAG: hypothetical protein A2Y34_18490 [Spirochaetes bacterium GWC1_27_15]|nr:MAG: hypothetical protein A2Y34_18490 [Spirochaetes bacterium GWC1_27_15]
METLADYFMEKGMEKGKIEESQKTLIKQLSKKFGLTNNEIELIKKCNTLEKLDIALEDILFLDNKFDVLKKIN